MAFIRTNKRENPFVQIDKTFTEDTNLTWAAKGLMVYLLSRPDNWKVNQTDLAKRSSCGESVVRNALLNLMEHGYVYYYSERNEKGHIQEWVYEVYEAPEYNPNREEAQKIAKEKIAAQKARNRKKVAAKKTKEIKKQPDAESPDVESPDVESPDVESPSYNNINYNNNDFNNNDFNNNLSIKEEIENLDIDNDLKNVLEKQIDRLIHFKIDLSDIVLHANATKDMYGSKTYAYVLDALLSNLKEAPNNFGAVMDNWLERNKQKQNVVIGPTKTEIVPDWLNEQKQGVKNGQVENEKDFFLKREELQAKLKQKYSKG